MKRAIREVTARGELYLHRDDLAAYLREMAARDRAASGPSRWASALDDVADALERGYTTAVAPGGRA